MYCYEVRRIWQLLSPFIAGNWLHSRINFTWQCAKVMNIEQLTFLFFVLMTKFFIWLVFQLQFFFYFFCQGKWINLFYIICIVKAVISISFKFRKRTTKNTPEQIKKKLYILLDNMTIYNILLWKILYLVPTLKVWIYLNIHR